MAIPFVVGAGRFGHQILKTLYKGQKWVGKKSALAAKDLAAKGHHGTSKFITGKGVKDKTGKFVKTRFAVGKKATELRPWAQSVVGKEGFIAKVGGGAKRLKNLEVL